MSELTIHYSVENCGDGSAYPCFCESQLVAEVHQDIIVNGYEGWGEQCTGSITVESDGPITIVSNIMTKDELLKELNEHLEECDDDYAMYRRTDLEDGIARLS